MFEYKKIENNKFVDAALNMVEKYSNKTTDGFKLDSKH